MIKRCQCTAHISGDWGPLWSCSKYFSKIQLGKNKVFLVECPKFALFLVKVKNLDVFLKRHQNSTFQFCQKYVQYHGSQGNLPYLLMNIHNVSNCAEICLFQPLRSLCNFLCQFSNQFSLFFFVFWVRRVKQTLSITPTEGWGTQGVVGANEEE